MQYAGLMMESLSRCSASRSLATFFFRLYQFLYDDACGFGLFLVDINIFNNRTLEAYAANDTTVLNESQRQFSIQKVVHQPYHCTSEND